MSGTRAANPSLLLQRQPDYPQVIMKDFYVHDAPRFENAIVTTYFCLSQLQLRAKKSGDGQYLALTLTDKTGALEARMWDDFTEAGASCAEGGYVKVQGQVSKYNGKFQITLSRMRAAQESEIDISDFQAISAFP